MNEVFNFMSFKHFYKLFAYFNLSLSIKFNNLADNYIYCAIKKISLNL